MGCAGGQDGSHAFKLNASTKIYTSITYLRLWYLRELVCIGSEQSKSWQTRSGSPHSVQGHLQRQQSYNPAAVWSVPRLLLSDIRWAFRLDQMSRILFHIWWKAWHQHLSTTRTTIDRSPSTCWTWNSSLAHLARKITVGDTNYVKADLQTIVLGIVCQLGHSICCYS